MSKLQFLCAVYKEDLALWYRCQCLIRDDEWCLCRVVFPVAQVNATRCSGWLQTGKPQLEGTRGDLLLPICLLHKVRCRHFSWSVHTLSTVRALLHYSGNNVSWQTTGVNTVILRIWSFSLLIDIWKAVSKWVNAWLFLRSISHESWMHSCWCCRFAGYDTGACRQPPPVVYTLKLLIGAAPVACITTGLMILMVYPISEDVRLRNKLALEELR